MNLIACMGSSSHTRLVYIICLSECPCKTIIGIFCALVLIVCSATWSAVLREIFCVPLCPHPPKKTLPRQPKRGGGGWGKEKENKKERRGEMGEKV